MLNKTIKTFIFIFIAVCSLSTFVSTVTAASETHVFSDGDYLSDTNIEDLEKSAKELLDNFGIHTIIYLTKGINNSEISLDTFSENYFNSKKYGIDAKGVMLLIDFDRRKIWITSYSSTMHSIFDKIVNQKIVDNISSDLTNKNYYTACLSFLNQVDSKLNDVGYSYKKSETVNSSTDSSVSSKKHYSHSSYEDTNSFSYKFKVAATAPLTLIISLIVAIIIPTIIAISSKGKNDITSTTYEDDGSFNLSRRDDIYVSTYTTSVRINNDNNSSGSGGSSSGSGNSGAGGSF